MFRCLFVIVSLPMAIGCWPVAVVHDANQRGEWTGTLTTLSAEQVSSGNVVTVIGLVLTKAPEPIKRGSTSSVPRTGSVVVLVDQRGDPYQYVITNHPVVVKGVWTDKYQPYTLGGNNLVFDRKLLRGVISVEKISGEK